MKKLQDMVGIVKNDIDYDNLVDYYVVENDGKRAKIANEFIAAKATFNSLKPDEKNPSLESLIKQYGPGIANQLMTTKFQVSLLINSNGGKGTALTLDKLALQQLTKEGSRVIAYVTDECASAATYPFTAAQIHYALDNTHFLWHSVPSNTKEDQEFEVEGMEEITEEEKKFFFSEEYKQEAKEQIKAFEMDQWNNGVEFLTRNSKSRKDALVNKLEEAEKLPRPEVAFTGMELKNHGVLRRTFKSPRLLMQEFCRRTGIKLNNDITNPIIAFFALPELTMQIKKNMNIAIQFEMQNDKLNYSTNDKISKQQRDALEKFIEDFLQNLNKS
jgi:hypothetical protein